MAAWKTLLQNCYSLPPIVYLFAGTGVETQNIFAFRRADEERFLGYIEGRLRVPVPKWWQIALKNCILIPGFNKDDRTTYHVDPFALSPVQFGQFFKKSQFGENSFFHHLKCQVVAEGSAIRIAFDDVEFPLPDEFTHWESFRFDMCVNNTSIFLLVYNHVDAMDLMAFDRKTGKEIWTTKVWGSAENSHLAVSGKWFHRATIVANAHHVVIFGVATASAFYIEGFDCSTGKVKCRFSTSYWYNR
jgi:hypothetical protein